MISNAGTLVVASLIVMKDMKLDSRLSVETRVPSFTIRLHIPDVPRSSGVVALRLVQSS